MEVNYMMNRIRTSLLSVLLLFLTTLGYAQQQESGPQPDSTSQQEEPHRSPDAAPPQQPPENKAPRQGRDQQGQPAKPEKQETPKPSKEQLQGKQEQHGQSAQKGPANSNVKSAHIPDAKFKADFGRQHSFTANRVIIQTTIVPRQTQFVASGVTFVFLDPWPSAWLFTDECYIEYVDDEYFLFDDLHPGVRVALLVVE